MNKTDKKIEEIINKYMEYALCENEDGYYNKMIEELNTEVQKQVESEKQKVFPDKNKEFRNWVLKWFRKYGEENRTVLWETYLQSLDKGDKDE